jgi:hypothetical protein
VVTVRAEMSRLRKIIGADYLDSRPYRLLKPIASDVDDVFGALHAGDVDNALSHYCGPLLPRSVSPAIARLRTELSSSMRGAVLAAGTSSTLRRWLDSPEGRDDREGWKLLYETTDAGSVARAHARARLAGIDFEFG